MNLRLPAASSAVLVAALVSPPRPVMAEPPPAGGVETKVDPDSGISETVFPNGLTLLVLPRPDDPVVSCQIWYRVGSRDENRGETGLSHFLEHMLFKGTDRYQKGDIDRLTQRGGGQNNASTSYDFTEYHFTFPADTWERALEIESNRMRNSAFLPDEFQAERTVVLQELAMNLDDPADVLRESVNTASFRVNGYHHPVLGWEEEVTSVPREAVKAYYLEHYTPDRATLVVVGGVDRDHVVARVGELFGPIARGNVKRRELAEPPPLGETRMRLPLQTNVSRLIVAFRSLSIRDPREPLLDVLHGVLVDGKASRLVKRLVDGGLAADVWASNDSRRDDGLFEIGLQANPGKTLEECEEAVREEIAAIVEKGPTAEEVRLATAKILAARAFQRESAERVGWILGYASTTTTWRYYLDYPRAVSAATPEAVQAVAKAVLVPGKAVVAYGVPASGDATGAAAEGDDDEGPDSGGRYEKGRRGRRFRQPPEAAAATIARALDLKPERVVLENGLTVLAMRRTSAPVLSAALLVKDGRLGEAVPGVDTFTGSLLEEGTTTRSGERIASEIGAVGGTLWAGASSGVRLLSKDAALGLSLLSDVVRNPAFAADAIERVRARQLAALDEERDTPQRVASLAFNAQVYGEAHPLGRSTFGSPESVKGIGREALVAHHGRFFVPGNAILAIVSDLEPAKAVALAREAFGAWKGEAPKVAAPDLPAPGAKSVFVPLEREQTNVFLGHLGIRRDEPDYVPLEVFDNVFGTGAGFTARLSMKIRDQMGLAYTVYGNITGNAGRVPGTFRMFAGVSPANAAKAVAEMRRELAEALGATPPTAEELAGAKAALRGNMVFRCETSSDLADLLVLCERFGLGFDYPKRYVEQVEAVTPEVAVAAARRHIRPEALVEVVVGPAPGGNGKAPAPEGAK